MYIQYIYNPIFYFMIYILLSMLKFYWVLNYYLSCGYYTYVLNIYFMDET